MTHLGLQQRPAVAPLVAVGACMMTRFPASRVFRMSLLGGQANQLWRHERQARYLAGRTGHAARGWRLSRQSRTRREGRKGPSRARRWRLAAPHLLTGPSSATCSAALVRPVKSAPWSGLRVICRSHRNAVWASQTRWCRGAMLRAPGGKLLDDAIGTERVWLGCRAMVLEGQERRRRGAPGQSSCTNAKPTRI